MTGGKTRIIVVEWIQKLCAHSVQTGTRLVESICREIIWTFVYWKGASKVFEFVLYTSTPVFTGCHHNWGKPSFV